MGLSYTKTSGLGSASDTTLVESLAGDAALGVDVLVAVECLVGVLHPRHFSLTSSKIWARDVDGGTDEAFLGELQRVSSCE